MPLYKVRILRESFVEAEDAQEAEEKFLDDFNVHCDYDDRTMVATLVESTVAREASLAEKKRYSK